MGEHDRAGAGGVAARSARTRSIAAASTASWPAPGQHPSAGPARAGLEVGQRRRRPRRRARRRAAPGRRTRPGRCARAPGARRSAGAEARAGGRESWLPLVSTTVRAGAGEPGQRLVEQGHRVDPRQGPVVDVTGDQDASTLLGTRPPRPGGRGTRAWASSRPTRWNERPRCQSEVWRIRTAPTLGRFQGHPWVPRQGCGRRDERLARGRRPVRRTSWTARRFGHTPAHDAAGGRARPRAAARRRPGVDRRVRPDRRRRPHPPAPSRVGVGRRRVRSRDRPGGAAGGPCRRSGRPGSQPRAARGRAGRPGRCRPARHSRPHPRAPGLAAGRPGGRGSRHERGQPHGAGAVATHQRGGARDSCLWVVVRRQPGRLPGWSRPRRRPRRDGRRPRCPARRRPLLPRARRGGRADPDPAQPRRRGRPGGCRPPEGVGVGRSVDPAQ